MIKTKNIKKENYLSNKEEKQKTRTKIINNKI